MAPSTPKAAKPDTHVSKKRKAATPKTPTGSNPSASANGTPATKNKPAEDEVHRMHKDGQSWAAIATMWERWTGEKVQANTVAKRYSRMKEKFVEWDDEDIETLKSAKATVEGEFERTKWSKIADEVNRVSAERTGIVEAEKKFSQGVLQKKWDKLVKEGNTTPAVGANASAIAPSGAATPKGDGTVTPATVSEPATPAVGTDAKTEGNAASPKGKAKGKKAEAAAVAATGYTGAKKGRSGKKAAAPEILPSVEHVQEEGNEATEAPAAEGDEMIDTEEHEAISTSAAAAENGAQDAVEDEGGFEQDMPDL